QEDVTQHGVEAEIDRLRAAVRRRDAEGLPFPGQEVSEALVRPEYGPWDPARTRREEDVGGVESIDAGATACEVVTGPTRGHAPRQTVEVHKAETVRAFEPRGGRAGGIGDDDHAACSSLLQHHPLPLLGQATVQCDDDAPRHEHAKHGDVETK